ncbi:hypothetical protein BJX64DRAFT_253842 [Aspergillus heterothallicus]
MFSTFPALRAVLLCSLALATASTNCVSDVTHNEFASFHGAPITFKLGLLNATACGQYCAKVPDCRAWSYVEGGGECDLYSAPAVSTDPVPRFVHGRCEETVDSVEVDV